MSSILCRKNARKSDSDFVVAAARAFYVDWWAREQEERGRSLRGEILDYAPPTARWAFRLARRFARDTATALQRPLPDIITDWLAQWDGDRKASAEMAGWYAAMQAMGHGVGLNDAGGIDVDLPYVESYPR